MERYNKRINIYILSVDFLEKKPLFFLTTFLYGEINAGKIIGTVNNERTNIRNNNEQDKLTE